MKRILATASVLAMVSAAPALAAAPDTKAVLTTYADIAFAGYEDSLISAKKLKDAVAKLVANPSDATLKAARQAWLAARVPYQQTEVYRFGNPEVDEWEGKVNAWPLDEGLIDYVSLEHYGEKSDENQLFTANIIANKEILVAGEKVDASKITKELLASLHEAGEVEANVTTGYHAIEFLLWGQDLNGTEAGAGDRKATDFDVKNCTNGNCDRRGEYLLSATDLLIDDLSEMVEAWKKGGEVRTRVLADESAGITRIVMGMGSLSYGELAGERTKLGLMLHDPEEEHDCFSDNTHYSHFYNAKGIQNVYLGSYTRIDGTKVSGPSLSSLVSSKDAKIDKELKGKLSNTMAALQVVVDTAKKGEAYDQMIAMGNAAGNAKVQKVVDTLVDQTKTLEKAVATLALKDVKFEGSDSLDDPSKVGN